MADNEAQSPENAPRLSLKTQYIRDLSFENPNAPGIFATLGEAPKVDLNLDLDGRKMADDHFELAIQITVRTSTEKTMFITELSYAGLFEVANIPEEHVEQILMVDCAMMLFRYCLSLWIFMVSTCSVSNKVSLKRLKSYALPCA